MSHPAAKFAPALLRGIACLLSLCILATQVAEAAPLPQMPAAEQLPVLNPGSVPAPILAAHTVFLTNSGADANFPIDITRAYNDLYNGLSASGHYQFVNSPAQADLIFQLRDLSPITDISGTRGNVTTSSSPEFRLTILDAHTNATLWTIDSPVYVFGSKQKREHWISISETNLVSRVKALSGQPLTAEEQADLLTAPKSHTKRDLWLIGGLIVVLAVGGAIATKLTLDHMKSDQDAFCKANNIPLSSCAGG